MAKITHLDTQSFNNLKSQSNDIYMIDFWAPWCAPCRAMEPMLDKLSQDNDLSKVNFAKINVDENETIAQEFNIQGIPNFSVIQFDKKNNSYKVLTTIIGLQQNPLDFKMKILNAAKNAAIDFDQV
jgi:thioredoxin 1